MVTVTLPIPKTVVPVPNAKNHIFDSSAEIRKHSPLITSLMVNFKEFVTGQKCTMSRIQLLQQLHGLIGLSDIFIITFSLFSYRPVLKSLYYIMNYLHSKEDIFPYEKSLMGQIETPVKLMVLFPIFLFIVDIISLVGAFFGFQFHIKGNIPQFFSNLAYSILFGFFLTRVKDWLVAIYRQKEWKFKPRLYIDGRSTSMKVSQIIRHQYRITAKERLFNELTSSLIWLFVGIYCLQTFSQGFGVGLGSIFAIGGIGSASFVLALRSTMENLLGGLLLKLQDKFHVREKISLPKEQEMFATVEEIHWLTTKLRKDDDSTISVPNAQFIHGEVINWSRTPYRLFKTTVNLKESNIHLLPEIINNLKLTLSTDEDIETENRDLIVSATGFNSGNIVIEIHARLKGNNDQKISMIKTKVVDKIALVVDDIYKSNNVTAAK
jgi:small-conductance mechanosensitive channel